ncbi:MAG: hypothetical protein U9Q92_05360 [archaeon]|nr:hypothetical protein [archaeon]
MSNYTQAFSNANNITTNITGNISGEMTTNESAWLNQTLNMTMNTTDTIITLENFPGLDAEWSEPFNVNSTNTTIENRIQTYGTNVSKMIHLKRMKKFLRNSKYNGTATFTPHNSSAYTDIMYCSDDNANICTRISACINSAFNGTACYIDKLTNITVHVPHFSSVILGNDTIAPQITIYTPSGTETNGFNIGINLTVTQDTSACNYSLNYSALANISMAKTNATHFTKTISAFLPDGDYTINITCKDANSNYNTTNKTFTVLDSIKPAMTTPTVSKTTTSATITWTTDEKTDARINYSTTTSLGTYKNTTENTTTHSITISGLSGSTTYYYNITSCDLEDNCNTTGPHSFTTSASGDIGGGTPGRGPTTSGAAIPPQAEDEEEHEQQTEPKKEEEEPKEEQATPEEDTKQKQEAQELISGAEHKIQSLKDKYDLKAATEKLEEAKKAFESKDYAKAKLLAAEALKLISQAEPKAEPQKAVQCPIIPHKILNICLIYIITTLIALTLATLLIISNRKKLSQRAPKTESPLPIHNTETIKPHTNEPEHHHHLDINEEISRLLKSLSETKPLLGSKDTVLAMDANNKIDQISLEIDQAKELMRSGNRHEAARHIKRGNRLLESIKEELSDSA